jgi:hypothetical protein
MCDMPQKVSARNELPTAVTCHALQVEFIREKYWEYGYEEVLTPNIFNFDLWKTSGHADHYKCGGHNGQGVYSLGTFLRLYIFAHSALWTACPAVPVDTQSSAARSTNPASCGLVCQA